MNYNEIKNGLKVIESLLNDQADKLEGLNEDLAVNLSPVKWSRFMEMRKEHNRDVLALMRIKSFCERHGLIEEE